MLADTPWKKLLEWPHTRGHFVQLYDSGEVSLARNVGRYLSEGLKSGDGALVIATPEHCELFCASVDQLGCDSRSFLRNRQLIMLDADETLDSFMTDGGPDWQHFERHLVAAMRELRPCNEYSGLRAYGEMVGIPWKARKFAAAIRLEQFWNKLLVRSSFSLYCAYAIDIFGKELGSGALDGVLCTHSHLVPAESDGDLDTAIRLATDEFLGDEYAAGLQARVRAHHPFSWAVMPDAEATLLWLRKNLPHQADEVIARARYHYDRLTRDKESLDRSLA